jgi:integrase
VVRATVPHERLTRLGIELGLDDRHPAPRTAGDNRVLSAQPDPEAVAGLGTKLPDGALVFPAPLKGGYQSPRAFSKEWAEVAESIGMPEVTFQVLRHTHASQPMDAGVDIVTISRRLGHASPNVTLKVYAHMFRKDDSKGSDAIDAALEALGAS